MGLRLKWLDSQGEVSTRGVCLLACENWRCSRRINTIRHGAGLWVQWAVGDSRDGSSNFQSIKRRSTILWRVAHRAGNFSLCSGAAWHLRWPQNRNNSGILRKPHQETRFSDPTDDRKEEGPNSYQREKHGAVFRNCIVLWHIFKQRLCDLNDTLTELKRPKVL